MKKHGFLSSALIVLSRRLHVSRSIKTIGCMLLCLPILFSVVGTYVHIFASNRAKAREAICLSNVKQIELGLLQYTADWDETYPPSRHWAELSTRYIEKAALSNAWHCPESASPFSYAFNQAVGGKAAKDMDELAATVCLFECDATLLNTVGGKERLPRRARHLGNVYGLLDGHAKCCNPSVATTLRWQPLFIPQEKSP